MAICINDPPGGAPRCNRADHRVASLPGECIENNYRDRFIGCLSKLYPVCYGSGRIGKILISSLFCILNPHPHRHVNNIIVSFNIRIIIRVPGTLAAHPVIRKDGFAPGIRKNTLGIRRKVSLKNVIESGKHLGCGQQPLS